MHEAKTNLSKLVERARGGEEIVIARNGEPMVKLVPVEDEEPQGFASLLGIYKGRIHIADDFDELPEEWKEAFGIED